jgi:hypothetical protein
MVCTSQGTEVCSLREQSLRRALQVKPSVGQAFSRLDRDGKC